MIAGTKAPSNRITAPAIIRRRHFGQYEYHFGLSGGGEDTSSRLRYVVDMSLGMSRGKE
jgi:hypothetical protein